MNDYVLGILLSVFMILFFAWIAVELAILWDLHECDRELERRKKEKDDGEHE